jgi:hypothetical protein
MVGGVRVLVCGLALARLERIAEGALLPTPWDVQDVWAERMVGVERSALCRSREPEPEAGGTPGGRIFQDSFVWRFNSRLGRPGGVGRRREA